jgi:WD repeat and SOF domain-containing protein 1
MKFEILSRSETEHTRARKDDALKIQRNLDPELHPFQQEREYARALRAAKLGRHFAKPFIGALEGHTDR